jgi:hypothetical protein
MQCGSPAFVLDGTPLIPEELRKGRRAERSVESVGVEPKAELERHNKIQ